MKSDRQYDRRIRIRDHNRQTMPVADSEELRTSSRRSHRRGLGGLSQMLLVAVALGRTTVGIATAFPSASSNRRHPLAIAVKNGQRKRPWQESRDEIETSLWQGFDRKRTRSKASSTRLNLFFNTRQGQDAKFSRSKVKKKVRTAQIKD